MKIDLNEEQLRQEVTIAVPLGWLLEYGEFMRPPQKALITERSARLAFAEDMLPVVGEPFSNEKLEEVYAGITLHDNEAYALVLLPGDFEGTWSAANEWATARGGELPTRMDALVLWQNVPGHFKKEAYWTSTQIAGAAAYAWSQHFANGAQTWDHKDHELRARAVRRVPL